MSVHDAALPRYLGQHGYDYHAEVCAVPARMYDAVARLRAEKFQPHIEPSWKVLEYGAGLGYNLSALTCAYKEAFDVGPHLREVFAQRGLPFRLETASCSDGSFDAVLCHHVLEHVARPWEALEDIKRIVRPGGRLLLHVPFEKERYYRRYHPADKNGHLFSWNVQTLGALCASGGWRVDKITRPLFGYDRFAAVVAENLGGSEAVYRLVRRALLLARPRYEIQALLTKPG